MGAAGAWNLDMSRAARETLPDYDQRSYYEIWFAALLKQLEERGLVCAEEVAAGRSLHAPLMLPRFVHARDVPTVQARGAPTERLATRGPRFAVGHARPHDCRTHLASHAPTQVCAGQAGGD